MADSAATGVAAGGGRSVVLLTRGYTELMPNGTSSVECLVEDCGKPAKAAGLCGTHYQRKRRTGDAQTVRKPGPKPRSGRGQFRERNLFALATLGDASDRSESRSHRTSKITTYLDARAKADGCDVPFAISCWVTERTKRANGAQNFAAELEYAELLWWVADNDPDSWVKFLEEVRQDWNRGCLAQGHPELVR